MNLIDRQKELGRLEKAIKGCKGKLLFVYGADVWASPDG